MFHTDYNDDIPVSLQKLWIELKNRANYLKLGVGTPGPKSPEYNKQGVVDLNRSEW